MPGNEGIYGEFAGIYDAEMASFRFYDRWKSLFERLRLPGRRAIDLACGTGAIARELAGRGWEVEGVDASAAMLAEARARGGGEAIRWTLGDIRTFEARRPVDLVTCAFDSLNYLLDPGDVKEVFRRAAAHLEPGGHFLFDALTPRGMKDDWGGGVRVRRGEGWFGTWESRFEAPFSRLRMTYFVRRPDGFWRRWEEEHTERGYRPADLKSWLRAAGLETLECRSQDAVTEATRSATRVHILAGRR